MYSRGYWFFTTPKQEWVRAYRWARKSHFRSVVEGALAAHSTIGDVAVRALSARGDFDRDVEERFSVYDGEWDLGERVSAKTLGALRKKCPWAGKYRFSVFDHLFRRHLMLPEKMDEGVE